MVRNAPSTDILPTHFSARLETPGLPAEKTAIRTAYLTIRKLISSPGKRDGLFYPGSDAPPTAFAEEGKRGFDRIL
jgi:hypothetical protein